MLGWIADGEPLRLRAQPGLFWKHFFWFFTSERVRWNEAQQIYPLLGFARLSFSEFFSPISPEPCTDNGSFHARTGWTGLVVRTGITQRCADHLKARIRANVSGYATTSPLDSYGSFPHEPAVSPACLPQPQRWAPSSAPPAGLRCLWVARCCFLATSPWLRRPTADGWFAGKPS